MIEEYFLKWLLGILTGALGTIVVFCRKKILKFIRFENKQKKDKMLKEVNKELREVNEDIEMVEEEVQEKSNAFSQELKMFKEEMMNIILPMREALLSSHYNSLLARCKEAIQKGEITFDELDRLEKDYETYKALGGNGHMESWMRRVRNLRVIV